MATTSILPVTPRSEFSVFVHRVLYAHMFALTLILFLIGAGGYYGLKSYDKALAHAEALQQQFSVAQQNFNTSQKALTDLLAADAAERAQQSSQQAALVLQIAQRNAQAPAPVVTQALAPNAGVSDEILGLQSVMSDVPSFGPVSTTPDQKIALSVPQAQGVVQELAIGKRSTADLQDEISLYTLETAKNTSLSNDLAQCVSDSTQAKVALADAKKSLAAYDKLAYRSKFRKILGGIGRNAERIGIAIVAFELGRKL